MLLKSPHFVLIIKDITRNRIRWLKLNVVRRPQNLMACIIVLDNFAKSFHFQVYFYLYYNFKCKERNGIGITLSFGSR